MGGDVEHSGVIDASADVGDGGYVRLTAGGGDITITSSGRVLAEGIDSGAGGTAILRAEGNLDVASGAAVQVSGGSSGAGGFIEISGHGGLNVQADLDLGSGGTLAVDPSTLNIVAGAGGFSSTAGVATVGELFLELLLAGGSVSNGADVWLAASDAINFNAGPIDGRNLFGGGFVGGDLFVGIGNLGSPSDGFSTGTPSFNQDAGGTINLNGDAILVDGDLTIRAGSTSGDILGLRSVSANNITLEALGGDITAAFGSIFVNAGGNVDIDAGGTGGISVSGSSASLSISAGGFVDVNANINVFGPGGDGAGGFLTVRGTGVNITGDVSVFGGNSFGTAPAIASFDAGSGVLTVDGNVSVQAVANGSPSFGSVIHNGIKLRVKHQFPTQTAISLISFSFGLNNL